MYNRVITLKQQTKLTNNLNIVAETVIVTHDVVLVS